MRKHTRRQFTAALGAAGLTGSPSVAAAAEEQGATVAQTHIESLNGAWQFRLDDERDWGVINVPHTWQVDADKSEYTGVAWYRREFDVPTAWRGSAVRIEFEAVYHSAWVTVNGERVGAHERRGYTAFCFDISMALRFGERNRIEVKVDNTFRDDMLPRDTSYDWVKDGGITRPVHLLVSPAVYIERIEVDADPDLDTGNAAIGVRAVVRNTSGLPAQVKLSGEVRADDTGLRVLDIPESGSIRVAPNTQQTIPLPAASLSQPRLWHFDHPHLYQLTVTLARDGKPAHEHSTHFGVRKIEVRDAGFYLNGERVWLVGVERMGGSNPEFGMAEPEDWLIHDHKDMKELNCVYSRVHWQQDRRTLDYCDRQGMLMQVEVPSWGPRTFSDMGDEPHEAIMKNGLEQLREMIERDRNHPCVFSWGLCNEVNGQNPAARKFVQRMFREAKRLDPGRLLTYASNSLQNTPERDVAGEMDFIMWNEYYESWMGKDVSAMEANLKAIHAAFPGKPIVISEFGYCECRPSHSGGDPKRIDVLRNHNRVFRKLDAVAGTIFFDYNDYRTHIGDKGVGPLKQRVHGVVDVYGNRKPSYRELREESSPIESIDVFNEDGGLHVRIRTRVRLPSYKLTGYHLRWIAFGFGDLPMERGSTVLPSLDPGAETSIRITLAEAASLRIQLDVMRPTGFSAWTEHASL